MPKSYVIIGASAASIAYISKLRSFDKESTIICISGESFTPYNRCFLADVLVGSRSFKDIHLKPESFFEENHIELYLGSWVTAIDTNLKKVFIDTKEINYDTLFLGMGSKPLLGNFELIHDEKSIFTFHTAHDIQKIRATIEISHPQSIAIIGGGINGIECASALKITGIPEVFIFEQAPLLLQGLLFPKGSDVIKDAAELYGIKVRCKSLIQNIQTTKEKQYALIIKNHQPVIVDTIVLALGAQTYHDLLDPTIFAMERGALLVNEYQQSSVPDVYAGGDICWVKDMVTKKLVKSATWPDAMLQGLCAATNMSTVPRPYPGYQGLRDSHFFGKAFYACGDSSNQDPETKLITFQDESYYKAFLLKNDRLIGFVLYGDTKNVGLYKQWYLTQRMVLESEIIEVESFA